MSKTDFSSLSNAQKARYCTQRSEYDKARFFSRKQELRDEIAVELSRNKATLKVSADVLLESRLKEDKIAKDAVDSNRWFIQQAIMYSNLAILDRLEGMT